MIKAAGSSSCKRKHDNQNNDDDSNWENSDDPVQAFSSTFLIFLGLLDISLRIFCIFQRSSSILIDFDKIGALLVHLSVDFFRNVIDISHELLDVVELFLPLLDDVFHVGCLALNFQLLNIELLLLK